MRKIDVLTGLRGIAAYSVLLAHAIDFSFNGAGGFLLLKYTQAMACFGMSLFFILSGFVIHYNYAGLIRSAGVISGGYQFIVNRFTRLYPLYFFGIIMSLGAIPKEVKHSIWLKICLLSMTTTWFNMQGLVGVLFGQSWSICTEWFFYFAYIFLLFPLLRIKNPKRALTIYIFSVIFILTIIFKFSVYIEAIFNPHIWWVNKKIINAPLWYFITYTSPYIRIFEFIAGILASQVYLSSIDQSSSANPPNRKIEYCLLWIALVILFSPSIKHWAIIKDFMSNFIFVPSLAPAIIMLCIYETPLSRFLVSPPCLFFGEISYSVYVFQFAIMPAFSSNFNFSHHLILNSLLKTSLIISFATLIGYGSYLLIERPAQKWLRDKLLGAGWRKKEVIAAAAS
jgi:peptidoglycan/LPS O-acetylase OafA/YrhL